MRKHRKSSRDKKKGFENATVSGKETSSHCSRSDGFSSTLLPPQRPLTQCDFVSSDSSSEDESAPPRFSPPRSRRRRKLPPGNPPEMLNGDTRPSSELRGSKIVGILKKPHGSGAKSNDNGTGEDGKVEESFAVPTVPSHASSTVSGGPILERQRGEGEELVLLGESQVSRDTIIMSSASTTKRVRFSDNLESSLNSSQTSVYTNPHPATAVNVNGAVELWKRVLPSSSVYGRSPPNGMFSPKMKISLSQRGQPHKHKPQTSDRITVHVPQASEYLNGRVQVGGGTSASTERDTRLKGGCGLEKRQLEHSGDRSMKQNTADRRDRGRDTVSQGQQHNRTDGRALHLDQSPTDAQIDGVWDEIQMQLYGGGDKVTLAPHVFQFHPDSQRGNIISTRGGEGGHSERPSQTHRYGNGKRFVTVVTIVMGIVVMGTVVMDTMIVLHYRVSVIPVNSERGEEESGRSLQGRGGEGGTRHLPHRPRQRPLRCQGGTGHQSHASKLNSHLQQKGSHHMTHPTSYQPSRMSAWEPRTASPAIKPGTIVCDHTLYLHT